MYNTLLFNFLINCLAQTSKNTHGGYHGADTLNYNCGSTQKGEI